MSRIWLALAAAVAFVAGRFTAPEAASAEPVVVVKTEKQVETVALHCPAPPDEPEEEDVDDDPDAVDAEDTELIRTLEVESKRIAELESGLGRDGALRGQVKDEKTGEHAPGVTVVASIGTDSFAAITDENGAYEIAPIPEGTYVVTFYYIDTAVEHRDVTVASRRVTPLYGKVNTTQEPVIAIEHGTGITNTDEYTTTITVERHFEGTLDHIESFELRSEPSGTFEGVTFHGSEATEDAYYD